MGITDKVTGRIKQAAGDLAGDDSLKRQGAAEERKGEAKEELAREEERAERHEANAQREAEAADDQYQPEQRVADGQRQHHGGRGADHRQEHAHDRPQ
jgi:uncharacterized protein YjbJ (UPF0337 family)